MGRAWPLAITLFLLARAATAASPATRLEYIRAPGAEHCPDRAAVVAAVSARLGYSPFSDDGARVLRCLLSPAAGGLSARIELFDAAGTPGAVRRLTSEHTHCGDIAPAMLLVLTVAARTPGTDLPDVGDDAAAPPAHPRDKPPPNEREGAPDSVMTSGERQRPATERGPPTTPVGATLSTVAPAPEPRPPLVAHLSAGVLGTAGTAPNPAWGLTAAIGLGRGRLSLAAEARIDAPVSIAAGSGRISYWMASGALVPCLHAAWFAGCLVAGVGVMKGEGNGVPGATTGMVPWLSAGARAAWNVPLGSSYALRLHADLLAMPVRAILRVGDEAVWRSPVVSGALGISVVRLFR